MSEASSIYRSDLKRAVCITKCEQRVFVLRLSSLTFMIFSNRASGYNAKDVPTTSSSMKNGSDRLDL